MDSGDTKKHNLLFTWLCVRVPMEIVGSTKQARDLKSVSPFAKIWVSIYFQLSFLLCCCFIVAQIPAFPKIKFKNIKSSHRLNGSLVTFLHWKFILTEVCDLASVFLQSSSSSSSQAPDNRLRLEGGKLDVNSLPNQTNANVSMSARTCPWVLLANIYAQRNMRRMTASPGKILLMQN